MRAVSFAVVLAVASLAMVAALVRFSRAILLREDADESARWGWIYAATWLAVLSTLVLFVGDDLRRNLTFVIGIPAVIVTMHALILRFAIAVRDAAERDRPRVTRFSSRFAPAEKEEEEEELPPPPPPTFAERIRAAFLTAIRWIVTIVIALLLVAIGENLSILHRFDAALAPHRTLLGRVLGVITAAGFAVFMTSVTRLALTKEQPRYAVAGALTAISGGIALAIVFTPPGVKLIVILAAAYALTRAALGKRPPALP